MTSVSHRVLSSLCGIALWSSLPAFAETQDEEEPPGAGFLEYLGMWEESDEDWQLLDEDVVAEHDERSDPVPNGEESTEKEDES